MTRRWLGLCVALIAAGGFGCSRKTPTAALPSVANNPDTPEPFRRALQSAGEQVSSSPQDPEAIRRLARLFHANGYYDEAGASYTRIAALPPGLTARDHYYLADLRLSQNDLAGAAAELNEVVRREPNYLPAHLALADVWFKTGREAEAEKAYAAALAIDADNPQAAVGFARIELQRGDDAAAVARLDKLLAAHPESTSGAALLAQVLRRRGELERAAALDQWSRQKPDPVPADPWKAALWADLYDIQRLGLKFEEYFKTGQIAEAMPFVQRIEELDPRSPIPPMLKGWSESQAHHEAEAVRQYRLALERNGDPEKICPYLVPALLAQGNVADAAALAADYHAKMPASIPIAIAYSDVALRQHDEKLARDLLTKILEREPYLYPQNMSLAKILWAAGERDAAAQCLRRVVAVYVRDVPSRALLGEYYLGKSDSLAAIKVLEPAELSAETGSPAQAGVRALLGAAYLEQGRHEEAQERWQEAAACYDRATTFAPSDPNAYVGKANACVQLGQFRAAAGALEKLSALDPKNPTIYLSLGDVLAYDGRLDEARRQWEKARPLIAAGDSALRSAIDLRLSGGFNPGAAR